MRDPLPRPPANVWFARARITKTFASNTKEYEPSRGKIANGSNAA
jgi:hypothetical protein